jgi:hypothetical protein
MFRPIRCWVLVSSLTFVGVGCVTPTPTPVPTATLTPIPIATLIPTAPPVPTATSISPTARATLTPTLPPTAMRTPTTMPTPLLFRRLETGKCLVSMASPESWPPWSETPWGRECGRVNGVCTGDWGCGELGIENNLDLDVVAVLTKYTGASTHQSILVAVYIQARQSFVITGLSSDNFLGEVYVALGEDWDASLAEFTRRAQYLHSTDRWMFFAKPKCSLWTVRLDPGFRSDLQLIPDAQFPCLPAPNRRCD